jgi:hypothetical protein
MVDTPTGLPRPTLAQNTGEALLAASAAGFGLCLCLPSPLLAHLSAGLAALSLITLRTWGLPTLGSVLLLLACLWAWVSRAWNDGSTQAWKPGLYAVLWLPVWAGLAAQSYKNVLGCFVVATCAGISLSIAIASWSLFSGTTLFAGQSIPVPAERSSLLYGLSGHHIPFGCSAALASSLGFLWSFKYEDRRRFIWASFALISAVACACSGSRTAVLFGAGQFVIIAAVAWHSPDPRAWKRSAMLGLIIAVLGMVHLTCNRSSAFEYSSQGLHQTTRTPLWATTVEIIADHPLIGIGNPARFPDEWLSRYDIQRWKHPPEFIRGAPCAHNEYLQATAIHGLPFIVLCLAALTVMAGPRLFRVIMFSSKARLACITGVGVACGGAVSMFLWDPSMSSGWLMGFIFAVFSLLEMPTHSSGVPHLRRPTTPPPI